MKLVLPLSVCTKNKKNKTPPRIFWRLALTNIRSVWHEMSQHYLLESFALILLIKKSKAFVKNRHVQRVTGEKENYYSMQSTVGFKQQYH